jgi:hypothetical protein
MAVARLARVERYFRTNENGHAETGGRINRCLRDANIANQGKAINLREVRGRVPRFDKRADRCWRPNAVGRRHDYRFGFVGPQTVFTRLPQ